MDVIQKRIKNICYLADVKYTRKALAEKLGYPDRNYVNQLCTGHGSFGGRTARKVEKLLDLSHGWMDDLHPELYDVVSVQSFSLGNPPPTPEELRLLQGILEASLLAMRQVKKQ